MKKGDWLIEWMDAVEVDPTKCGTPCGTPEVPGCPCDQRMEEIRSILRSYEADQRDAARYRWLRENGMESIYSSARIDSSESVFSILAQTEALDLAVDLAMNKPVEIK